MRKIFLFILLTVFSVVGNAQTKAIKDLKAQQKKTMEQLALTSKLIDQNKKNTSTSLSKLTLLGKQIEIRQSLIDQINNEISLTSAEIENLKLEIEKGEKELQMLKEEYANLVYHAYWRHNSMEKLMFILSANSFSQSYRRFRYLQELSIYRKEQAQQIEQLTAQLNQKLGLLQTTKQEKEKALNVKKIESQQLTNEKNKQAVLVQNLKAQEKSLLKKLNAEQKKINQLNDKITKLIAEEERKAQERARLAAQKSGKPAPVQSSTTYALTKEEQLIAGNFEKNKGRLPWPVEKGFISGKFGLQPHPVLAHVTTNNKGIYIQTEQNAVARAVFEGEVTQRFAIPGNNYAVIIKHGNYRTVYTNLVNIYVKEGDHVSAKQAIGKIYTDTEDGNKTELYFMIYKDKELQNPELFLSK